MQEHGNLDVTQSFLGRGGEQFIA